MATKSLNISLTPQLKASIDDRVKSGRYGNASDVVRAGLRALAREEMGASLKQFEEIIAKLPDSPPITPELEERIESRIRRDRKADRRKASK